MVIISQYMAKQITTAELPVSKTKEEIIKECISQVMDIVKEKNER